MDMLPNEILSKIIYQVLISSNFVPGLTTDVTFTIKCAMSVNTRFRDLTQRAAFQILSLFTSPVAVWRELSALKKR